MDEPQGKEAKKLTNPLPEIVLNKILEYP